MESTGNRNDGGGSDQSNEGAEPEPREGTPLTERISITGLDQQSAEALRMAVARLARRYGVEVRTEVTEEPPRSQE
jgi:hypothetical protein